MGSYRKNIGGGQQVIRGGIGLATGVAAFVFLSGPPAWLVAASGLVFALTGVVGYCPMCAVAGIGRRERS